MNKIKLSLHWNGSMICWVLPWKVEEIWLIPCAWNQSLIAKIVVHDLLDFTSQGRERLPKAISISSIRHMTRGNLLYIPLGNTLLHFVNKILTRLFSGLLMFNYSRKLFYHFRIILYNQCKAFPISVICKMRKIFWKL